jgi:hypothetical protein
MRTHRIVRSLVLAAGLACAGAAQAQTLFGTGITYQGQLKDGAQAANGTYQFVFSLYDAASGGNFVDRVGSTSGPITIPVVNGLFTQELGFPQAAAFNGADRWLEIQVRPQGGTGYTTLGPRQKMTAAPYALQTRGLLSITGGNAVMTRIGPGTPLSMYTGIEFANGERGVVDGAGAGQQSARDGGAGGDGPEGPDRDADRQHRHRREHADRAAAGVRAGEGERAGDHGGLGYCGAV